MMGYKDILPAEHPDVIEIDNVIYIRTDAIPGQVNVENYNPGRDQWMAIGHNEVLQEIERIIEGIVMSDVRVAFEMVDKKLDCDRAWIAACKWQADKNEPSERTAPDGLAMKKQGDSILVQLHENDEFIRGRWINQEDDPIVFEFMCAILKDTPEPQESSNE